MARRGPADLRLDMFSDLLTPFEEYDRYSGIGASEVASIMGCGFDSSLTLARTKKTRTPKEFGPGSVVRFDRGHREERIAADIYRDERARSVERLMKLGTLRHPDYPWAYCSPDRIIANRRTGEWLAGLEIKHTDPWNGKHWGKGEDTFVPPKVEWQCRYTLWIVNAALESKGFEPLHTWWIMARIGFFDDRYYAVNWNMVTETKMVGDAERFWHDCVLGDQIPEPAGHPDDLLELKSLYPEDTDEEYIEADDKMNVYVPELHGVKAELKVLNKRSRFLEGKIRHAIKENAGMYGDGWTAYLPAKDHGDSRRRTLKIELGEKADVEGETTGVLQPTNGEVESSSSVRS